MEATDRRKGGRVKACVKAQCEKGEVRDDGGRVGRSGGFGGVRREGGRRTQGLVPDPLGPWLTPLAGFLGTLLLLLPARPAVAQHTRSPVCSNAALIDAVKIIDSACSPDGGCRPDILSQLDSRVDKPSLMVALRHPALAAVHLFFPSGRTRVGDILDWQTLKRDQLGTFRFIDDPAATPIFILGRASRTGSVGLNWALSRDRVEAVRRYLRQVVCPTCTDIRTGYLGKETLRLFRSDARLLNLEPQDYRQDDDLILNQSVHVFVLPCPGVLRNLATE